jgi:hypothetical protein
MDGGKFNRDHRLPQEHPICQMLPAVSVGVISVQGPRDWDSQACLKQRPSNDHHLVVPTTENWWYINFMISFMISHLLNISPFYHPKIGPGWSQVAQSKRMGPMALRTTKALQRKASQARNRGVSRNLRYKKLGLREHLLKINYDKLIGKHWQSNDQAPNTVMMSSSGPVWASASSTIHHIHSISLHLTSSNPVRQIPTAGCWMWTFPVQAFLINVDVLVKVEVTPSAKSESVSADDLHMARLPHICRLYLIIHWIQDYSVEDSLYYCISML